MTREENKEPGGKRTSLEAKRHVAINNPANNDQEGGNTKSNLDTRANRDAHGEVHLIAHGDDDGGNVLGGVADNGDEDETDKGFADVGALDNVVDAADEVVGADGDEDGGDDEDHGGGNGAEDGLFVLARTGTGTALLVVVVELAALGVGLALGLALGVKEVAVGAQLEDEVEDVEEEEDDGGAAREGEDGLVLVGGAGLFHDAVELGGRSVSNGKNGRIQGEKLTAAGMTSEADESVMREQAVWATAAEKTCSVPAPLTPRCLRPPKRKHMPMTSSRLERMEPSMEAWTTSTWLSLRATMLTCEGGGRVSLLTSVPGAGSKRTRQQPAERE